MRLGIAWLAASYVACATQVPEGTRLQIRLTGPINTANAKVDQQFGAVMIAPVVVGGQIVVAAGVKVTGHIKEVAAAVKSDDQAVLALAFDRLIDSSGNKAEIVAKLVAVDNARESMDKDGRILGIIAAQTGSGRLDQGINKVSEKYSGLGELLGTIKQAVLKEPDANIDYEVGVEMTIELTKALVWTGDARGANVSAIEPASELAELVNAQPFRTAAVKPAKASDITNLMFLGSEEDLRKAFQAAGWSTAEQLNATSKLETFRAMAEQRGYKEAPVSVLFLNVRAPDMVFQKQNNTFNARHHLRIWRRPERFQGQTVWVGAATHDTGIDFSEENRTFIHKVDGAIDHERAKVANDLLFTGLVKGIALAERPSVPVSLFNATGDKITTDARMVVISF